jgi:predicted methyltransferase
MRRTAVTLFGVFLAAVSGASAVHAAHRGASLERVIAGPQRSAAHRARDVYRHPAAVLKFFGLRPRMTVVEVMPGAGGWWTEILAPYLKDRGRYFAALPDQTHSTGETRGKAAFLDKIASDPDLYGQVTITHLDRDKGAIAPAGSADLVLTFRNLHDWMRQGLAPADIRAFYRALKPGGILGVIDHRARTDKPQDPEARSGYVRTDYAIHLIEAEGFKLVATSEIEANPRDTTDHPAGVWTLPPTLRLKNKDRAKYLAIGESDRFTLKFVKPANP